MISFKHDKCFTVGLIAAGGTLAMMIPPSISMIIYSTLTDESLGKLFIAGIIPGVLNAIFLIVAIRIIIYFRPNYAPKISLPAISVSERLKLGLGGTGMIALFVLVMGGIYTGLFTPSQAGAVGSLGALVIFFFYVRHQWLQRLAKATFDSTTMAASLFIIIIAGIYFGRFLVKNLVIHRISEVVFGAGLSPMVLILFTCILYIVMGMFLPGTAIKVITLPFLYPILIEAGFDGTHLGIIMVKLAELGTTTPPFGMTLFAIAAAARDYVKLEDVYKGILLFLGVDFLLLIVIMLFPQLSLWLPGLMWG